MPETWLKAVPVSSRVNSPHNDDERIIQPEGVSLKWQDALI